LNFVVVSMRVDLVSLPAGSAGASARLLSEWRVGAILQAIAVRDAKSGELALDIGGQRHPARLASGEAGGPRSGERLQLRVLRNSPVLALETLSAQSTTQSDTDVVAEALRRYVPRQESPALMLANLAWIAQGKSGAEMLPRAVVQAAAHLWHALPQVDALGDPAALKTALARSGVFLEANLAQDPASATAPIASDLKTLMLALSRSLQTHGAKPAASHTDPAVHSPVPTAQGPLTALPAAPATLAVLDDPLQQLNELSRQTDGALARLTTVQLSNSAPDPIVQSMLIDLPVRHEDRAAVLRFRIERDGSRRRSGESDAWTVEAAVDLGTIGALHARVTLIDKRIGVQLRAESPVVVEALSRHALELEALLSEAGLEVDRVVCLHGMPAGDVGVRAARLLDVRA
jgi:hypothetical protein